MRAQPDRESGSIDDFDAQAIIRRAGELQALSEERTTVHELKRLAEEVGIEPQYVEEALAELRHRNPRAFTTTVCSPLPFGISSNGRPMDPLERRESLDFLASVNEHPSSLGEELTNRLGTCPPAEFERRAPIALDDGDFKEVAAWLAQKTRLAGNVVMTGSALVTTLDLGWVYPRLQIVSRAGRSRMSLHFRGHASPEALAGCGGLVAISFCLTVASGEPILLFADALVLVFAIGLYASAGSRARNKGRRVLDELSAFINELARRPE